MSSWCTHNVPIILLFLVLRCSTFSVNAQELVDNEKSMTNVSMGLLEDRLKRMNVLEDQVITRIEGLASHFNDPVHADAFQQELRAIKQNLTSLQNGLHQAIIGLDSVEKVANKQQHDLKVLVQHQLEEDQEHAVIAEGAKAVDYETGHLRKNITVSSVTALKKLQMMERAADPAVLHYDLELLGEIAILFAVAAIGGVLASVVNAPPIVGYLCAGALVGPNYCGFVRQYTEVETISLLGSIFLLFAHGAQYSLQHFTTFPRKYLVGGLVYTSLVIGLTAITSIVLGWANTLSEGLVYASAISLSSTLPIHSYVKRNNLQASSFGKITTAMVLVQDFLMCVILAIPEILASESVSAFMYHSFTTALSFIVVITITVLLNRRVIPSLLQMLVRIENDHHSSSSSSSPLMLLGIVSVCLTMSWFTELIGLSLECGAFVAGVAFIGSETLSTSLEAIRCLDNLFGSIFFASIGMIISPIFLYNHMGDIVTMITIIGIIKATMAFLIIRAHNAPSVLATRASISLTQIGEFSLIFMIKAQSLSLVSRHLYLLFLATTVIFLGFSPVLHRRLSTTTTTTTKQVKDFVV